MHRIVRNNPRRCRRCRRGRGNVSRVSAALAHPCARGISASLHVTFGDDALTGCRPRTAGDFCFGKSHQNHFSPAPSPVNPTGTLIASVALAGPSKGHPAPAGGRARSLSHPFGPAFVSVGIRLGVRRTNYQTIGERDVQERPSATSSDVQEAQVPRVHGRTGVASARP